MERINIIVDADLSREYEKFLAHLMPYHNCVITSINNINPACLITKQ